MEGACRRDGEVREVTCDYVWYVDRSQATSQSSERRKSETSLIQSIRTLKNVPVGLWREHTKSGPRTEQRKRPEKPKPASEQWQRQKKLVLWWNCAGRIASKLNMIKEIINDLKPVVFFVSESNINSDKIYSHLNIENYKLFISDSRVARSACYLSSNADFKVVSRGDGTETFVIENDHHHIFGVYRPFKVQEGETINSQFDKLLRFLELKCNSNKNLTIAGDFNVDYAKQGDPAYRNSRMLEGLEIWAANHGLAQQISETTCHRTVMNGDGTFREEKSTIDHHYSILDVKPYLIPSSSDHMIIAVNLDEEQPCDANVKIKRRDWRRYDEEKIRKLFNEDQDVTTMMIDAERIDDVSLLNEKITKIYKYALDRLAPQQVFIMRRDNHIVKSAIEAMKKRRNRKFVQYKKTGNSAYLRESEILTKKLKRKINIVEKICSRKKAESKDPTVFWNMVNELKNGKKTKYDMRITDGDNLTSNKERIANLFAELFDEKIKN